MKIAIAVFLILAGIAAVIGGNIAYTRIQVAHECQALNLLLKEPAPKPANPTANPSRVFAYQFHQDIHLWAKADGC